MLFQRMRERLSCDLIGSDGETYRSRCGRRDAALTEGHARLAAPAVAFAPPGCASSTWRSGRLAGECEQPAHRARVCHPHLERDRTTPVAHGAKQGETAVRFLRLWSGERRAWCDGRRWRRREDLHRDERGGADNE